MKSKLKNIINRFIAILKKPEMRVLPGQLAFYFLMSFIPIFAITILISSLFISDVNLFAALQSHVPAVVFDILNSVLSSANSYNNFTILIILYIFLASNGLTSIIITSNTLYGIQNPKGIQTKIKAFLMTIIVIVLLLFIIFIPVLGNFIIDLLLSFVSNPEHFYIYMPIYKVLKFLTSFFFIFLCINLIYTLAPDKKVKGKQTTIGALFTAISWILVTDIFVFYITNIANYSALYGNFANILVLLTWVYLLAYLFVFGMALNVNFSNNMLDKNGSV